MLTETITYALRSGVGSDGDPTFGSQSTSACRIDHDSVWVERIDGGEFSPRTIVTTEDDVSVGSRVWLPGANVNDDDESLPVLSQKKSSFPNGGDLFELVV